MNEILAVIISYNPDESIINLYDSIKDQVTELIIIDNFTTDEKSKKHLEQLTKKGCQIIYNNENYGVAKALNQGAEYAINKGYQWLLTLDQDSKFIPKTYEILLNSYDKMEEKDKTMLIAPKYIEKYDCKNFDILNSYDINSPIQWKKEKFIITSGSLIKTEAFNNIGFFEEKLFIDNVDFDFCLRLNKKGFFSKIATNIFFIHNLGNRNSNTYNFTPTRRYYMARNSIYILRKYFFYIPKKSLSLVIHSGILFSSLRVIFFERDKLKKVYSSYKGLIDGILNKF